MANYTDKVWNPASDHLMMVPHNDSITPVMGADLGDLDWNKSPCCWSAIQWPHNQGLGPSPNVWQLILLYSWALMGNVWMTGNLQSLC